MSKTEVSSKKVIVIHRLSDKGRGRAEESKLEILGALPGEEVLVDLSKKIRGQVKVEEFFVSSPDRVKPICSHFPECGGCVFQHLDYAAQLIHKENCVKKEFESLLDQDDTTVDPIIGCQDPWRYRNKMEFSFSENLAGEKFLGLMLAGRRGKVGNLSECFLVSKWFIDALLAVRDWWKTSGLAAYHFRKNIGHLRTLTLREAKQGKGKMVMLTVSGNPSFALKKSHVKSFIECIKKISPDESLSIFLQIQQIAKGRPTQFFEMLLDGPDHITEKLHIELNQQVYSLEFKISPTSFFQPNTLQAQNLYSKGLGMVQGLRGGVVWDLYCGGATLGLSAAKVAKKVVGIELNPHSVFDATWNEEVNGIENFSIYRGDVGEILSQWKQQPHFSDPDVVILDPPRAGLSQKALETLQQVEAKEILYISCHPKTQATNIKELLKGGYRLKRMQTVDQFPHTVHIENICLLQKT